MARKQRVEFPGAIYHVINRGDCREKIYRDSLDRARCRPVREAVGKTTRNARASTRAIASRRSTP